jgi:hypothetical protein
MDIHMGIVDAFAEALQGKAPGRGLLERDRQLRETGTPLFQEAPSPKRSSRGAAKGWLQIMGSTSIRSRLLMVHAVKDNNDTCTPRPAVAPMGPVADDDPVAFTLIFP